MVKIEISLISEIRFFSIFTEIFVFTVIVYPLNDFTSRWAARQSDISSVQSYVLGTSITQQYRIVVLTSLTNSGPL